MKPNERIFLKSPFDNVLNFLSVVPQGHEKALKQALYNAVALLSLALCCAASCALFFILEPFVKPLIWALLIGSVLHPFKRSLEKRFETWLNYVEASTRPILFTILTVPIHIVDDASEAIGVVIGAYLEWLIGLCICFFLAFMIYTYIPNIFITTVLNVWTLKCDILLWLLSNLTLTVFATSMVIFLTLLIFCWSEERKIYFTVLSYLAWISLTLFAAKSVGFLAIPFLIFLIGCFTFGFIYEIRPSASTTLPPSGNAQAVVRGCVGDHRSEEIGGKEPEKETQERGSTVRSRSLKEDFPTRKSDPEIYVHRNNIPEVDENHGEESSKYLYAVVWACGLVLLWKNLWLTHLLPIPIAYYVVKRIGFYFGVWAMIQSQFECLFATVIQWTKERESVLFPSPILGLSKFSHSLRRKLMCLVRDSINPFASTLVILGLILFLCTFTSFLVLKIYAEGIHMVAMGASVINATVVHNPEFLQLLPEGWSDQLESMLNNAYIYGREGISKQLRSLLKDAEPSKAQELERHVLEFWDRVYQAWLMSAVETSHVGPRVPPSAVIASWHGFLEILQTTPGILNVGILSKFIHDNLETLFSLMESVYALLKGNLNLVCHFLLTAFSVLLGGGTAVLNFLVSGIVFFTALFYLLSSSHDLYKPVDMISNFSPVNGIKLGVAFEAAINSVFKASFKMAAFYGLWTWLMHSLFQVRIVYLPSVLAAILGAVPFLGTYWASIPAVLELWLSQGQGMLAIALFVSQCLPMSFVDTAIYTEIRGGGHPYMTGLAIAGGVFCMGIEGAILGPLLLCCLLVALSMSSNLMKESPTDTHLPSLSMRQLRRGLSNVETGGSKTPNKLLVQTNEVLKSEVLRAAAMRVEK